MTKPSFGTQVTVVTTQNKSVGASGVTVLAPHYLGRYEAAHPSTYNVKDRWTVYDTDDSPIQVGVYYYTGSAVTRVTTSDSTELQGMMLEATEDIAWAEKHGYQTVSAYGGFETVFQAMGAVRAYIDELFLNSANVKNTLYIATGGTVYGGARFSSAGTVVSSISKGFYLGADGTAKFDSVEILDVLNVHGIDWKWTSVAEVDRYQLSTNPSYTVGDCVALSNDRFATVMYGVSNNSMIISFSASSDTIILEAGPSLISDTSYFWGEDVAIAALGEDKIAAFLQNTLELRMYERSGTTWSMIGSALVCTSGSIYGYNQMTAINDSTVIIGVENGLLNATSATLLSYSWSGSVWSTVDSVLQITGKYYPLTSLCAVKNDEVAITYKATSTGYYNVEKYKWTSSQFTQIGQTIPISFTGDANQIACLSYNEFLYSQVSSNFLKMFHWNGDNYVEVQEKILRSDSVQQGVAVLTKEYFVISEEEYDDGDAAYYTWVKLYKFEFNSLLPYKPWE